MELNKNLNINKIINEEEMDLISKITSIKRAIKSYMDIDKFIEVSKKIINESEHFKFRNERDEKFIDKNAPKFMLSTNLLEDITIDNNSNQQEIMDKIINPILDKEIIDRMTECITNSYINNRDEIFSGMEDVKEFSEMFISNIYTIRHDLSKNMIQISYFI